MKEKANDVEPPTRTANAEMKHMVLILAGGIKRKWKSEDYPIAFLIPIAGEPLIVRVVRQLSERGLVPTIITHIPEVTAAVPSARVIRLATPTARYVDTILKTVHLWADMDKLTVLHGDMVWDEVALDFVLSSEGSPMFFGGVTGVVAAFGAMAKDFGRLVDAAKATKGKFASEFYCQFGDRHGTPNPYHSKLPSGYSGDFDDFVHYQKWIASRKWAR